MEPRPRLTNADRARAHLRVRRITVATGVASAAALVAFGGIAAVTNPGHQVSSTTDPSSTQPTTTDQSTQSGGTSTDSGVNGGNGSFDNGNGFQAPALPPGGGFGGGQTTTGGS